MIIPFSSNYACSIRSLVLEVLGEEGFAYDTVKDSDLENIQASYLDKGGAFFIALEAGELAGTSAVRRVDPDTCEIRRVYVRKDMRGLGIGGALFRTALVYAAANCRRVTLKTDVSLHTAIGMYLRHGFTVIKKDGSTLYFEKMCVKG